MTHPFKLVALDVDGTLLNPQHQLSPRNAAALRALVAKGVHVVLSTGKMYVGIEGLVAELGLSSPQITSGGAVITENGQLIQEWTVPKALAVEVIEMCEAMGLTAVVLRDGKTYAAAINADTDYMETYSDPHPIVVQPLTDGLEPEPTQIYMIAYRQDARFNEAVGIFEQKFGKQLSVKRSSPYYLEFIHPNASKGTALQFLSQRLQIDPTEMLAIGDSFNDLSMFATVGHSVAMGHSPAQVQAAATEVTATNGEDGVALALERLILAHL